MKSILSLALVFSVVVFLSLGLSACGNSTASVTPQNLQSMSTEQLQQKTKELHEEFQETNSYAREEKDEAQMKLIQKEQHRRADVIQKNLAEIGVCKSWICGGIIYNHLKDGWWEKTKHGHLQAGSPEADELRGNMQAICGTYHQQCK